MLGWQKGMIGALVMGAIACAGCNAPQTAKVKKPAAKKTTTAKKNTNAVKPLPQPVKPSRYDNSAPELPTPVPYTGNVGTTSTANVSESGPAADEQLLAELKDTSEFGPTLVVWIFDRTDSALAVRNEATAIMRNFYTSRPSAADAKPLLTAVVSFGAKVDDLPEPTADTVAAVQAASALAREDQTTEVPFTALHQAVEKYLPYRTQQRHEVRFVLVTDEMGSDHDQIEPAIAICKKNDMRVFVIGVPAPFGKAQLEDMRIENRDGKNGITIGPESRDVETVALESLGPNDFRTMESGFGPYYLEWVCRATDGKFLAIRSSGNANVWPEASTRRFDAAVMKKYAPRYVNDAEYQKQLQNGALTALVNAGKLPRAEVRASLRSVFIKRDEAQFKREIDKAQQPGAKLEQAVNAIYDALVAGEGDRAKLTEPRLQAAYDLAMGRACAAKARLDGYNAMLANLKNGKNFANPSSTTWNLMPAETTEAGSSISKLVERSQMYLKRVVEEHPNTPWALLAEPELNQQVGWKWTEQ